MTPRSSLVECPKCGISHAPGWTHSCDASVDHNKYMREIDRLSAELAAAKAEIKRLEEESYEGVIEENTRLKSLLVVDKTDHRMANMLEQAETERDALKLAHEQLLEVDELKAGNASLEESLTLAKLQRDKWNVMANKLAEALHCKDAYYSGAPGDAKREYKTCGTCEQCEALAEYADTNVCLKHTEQT